MSRIYKGKVIEKALLCAFFHGESWYKCPYCDKSFEFYDTQFSSEFEKLDDHIFLHKPCGNIIEV